MLVAFAINMARGKSTSRLMSFAIPTKICGYKKTDREETPSADDRLHFVELQLVRWQHQWE